MSIDLEVLDDGVAVITINRPEKRNAFDAEHYRMLSQAWTRVRDDAAIRCAVITGAGDKAFSSGADLKSVIGHAQPPSEHWLTQKDLLLNRGLEIWKPVIAAINGYCLAGGMTLMLATDIRIAAATAERWGLVNRVVPMERLMPTALEFARRIAANAPLAVQAAKEIALRAPDVGLQMGLRLEQYANRMLSATEDTREGTAAFAEKRAPRFRGA
jgi:E-phenylitaconyl-CoA hydratase